MTEYTVTFLPQGITVPVKAGCNVLQAQILAGLRPDAPCGGKGTCGKCRVMLEGREVLACQTPVDRDMTVRTADQEQHKILTGGIQNQLQPDGTDDYAMAFDVGTTTLVAYLLDGHTGALLARSSCINPQNRYGADVISRIQHALDGGGDAMAACVRGAMEELTQEAARKAGIPPERITASSVVGNTAMHHLLLGIDPGPLVTPPYMPAVFEAIEKNGARILPNIAGFVGGDTVGCMAAVRFDRLEELSLLIDIGTNGEMVLGNKNRRIACSTAAGPAFEGARISCGMRGAEGAVDHVAVQDGEIVYHTIADAPPRGLCGSGLLDLVAVLLDREIIDESGRLEGGAYRLCDNVTLTQKDVREVQLAKAAIRAGIELMCKRMGVQVEDIRQVLLAGAFGNYLDPHAACALGMIPPVLRERILPIGNAAGEGARMAVLSGEEYEYSKRLARDTEFLELASMQEFNDCYVDCLCFEEE